MAINSINSWNNILLNVLDKLNIYNLICNHFFYEKSSKIAVIGGGPMGLAVAYELTLQGYKPVIFESDNRLGGMAACFDFEGLEIERYYHFHCLNDKGFFRMLDEIGLKDQLNWKKTKMGFYYQGNYINGVHYYR